jgi:DNA topoisomerase IB
VREETKFGRMIAFGAALPKIRKQVNKDLSLDGLPKQKVVALSCACWMRLAFELETKSTQRQTNRSD